MRMLITEGPNVSKFLEISFSNAAKVSIYRDVKNAKMILSDLK